ncbi:hypothetical protein O3M35_004848 [Rhynocoris fuscipes]|uniref:Golgin subfamily A conserved domain-containing protein n=1 Tax=Rhynocoris fuscipes TaxID=488301 RepID=A0AAW1DGD8_9HEMI
MDEKTKAEKRAAGRLLLQKYQKKTKDGKASPSHRNNPSDNTVSIDLSTNEKNVQERVNNGDLVNDNKTTTVECYNGAPVDLFTFQKNDSPAEQFFDSFRSSPPQSSPDHSDKCENINEQNPTPLYNIYNTVDRIKENDRAYDGSSTTSRSSKSDDEALKRLMEGQLFTDNLKEEMEKKLTESIERIMLLENEIMRTRQEVEKSKTQEVALEESVRLHLKTIEMLVGEKSELQLELSKVKEESNSNKSKCEEMSGQLKAAMEEIATLKTDLSETYEAREQHNTILKKLEHSLAEANATAELHRKEVIDANEEIKLLKQKIDQLMKNTQEMKKLIDDKDKQLSMAEMRLAQLGDERIPTKDDVNLVENLEKECARLNEEINKLKKEKSDTVSEYQQYINTLNSHMKLINQQYESCLVSKNQLLTREESLVKHISELEKKVQKEHQAGPSLTETNAKLNQELKDANAKLEQLNSSLKEKEDEIIRLNAALEETSTKLNDAELTLERLEIPDARKLQAAMESDRVAATRAIHQNTQLKQHVVELQEAVVRLNNEKLDLTEKWQHEQYVTSELNRELKKFKGKADIQFRDAVAQSTVVFYQDQSCQANIDDIEIPEVTEHVTPEAVVLLERKLKKTMNDYANLHEEKQKLEHLVLHLQSETETIGEYVTLYQNQRCLLQERSKERDRQMAALSKEREELKAKLAQISSLLPQVIPESGSDPVKPTVPNGLESGSPAAKIKNLLTEIETSNLMTDSEAGIHSNFHPCLLCSGKLITI